MSSILDLGVHALRASYSSGTLTCRAVVEEVLARIATAGDDKVWISRAKDADLLAAPHRSCGTRDADEVVYDQDGLTVAMRVAGIDRRCGRL